MHFGKQLRLLAYQPWKDRYVDFVALKHLIKVIRKDLQAQGRTSRAPSAGVPAHAESPPAQESPIIPPVTAMTSSGSSACSVNSTVALVNKDIELGVLDSPSSSRSLPHSESNCSTAALVPPNMKLEEDTEEGEIHVLLTEETKERFLAEIDAECSRVDQFFQEIMDQTTFGLEDTLKAVRDRKDRGADLTPIKKRFFDLLFTLEELGDFCRLNLMGFTKIVKKFVRNTDYGEDGRRQTLAKIHQSRFVHSVPDADALKVKVKLAYAESFREDPSASQQELEQSVAAARSWKMNTILFQFDEHLRKATVKGEKKKAFKPIPLVIAVIVFFILTFVPIFHADKRPAQRCLAILVSCLILWVSECWPLFITALLVPLLVTLCSVLMSNGKVMNHKDAAKDVMKYMFPNNVSLILAGFSIAECFKKYGLDIQVVNFFLRRKFWNTPHRLVIIVEFLCFFMSMWIGNVAGSVLALTIIMPVIRDLPENCNYIRTLIMASAVAGNIGGMPTQIASPQSSVASSLSDGYSVDFVSYIAVALPLCPILLIGGHFLVIALYPPDVRVLPDLSANTQTGPETTSVASAAAIWGAATHAQTEGKSKAKRKWMKKPWRPYAVMAISLIAIALWIASAWLTPFGASIGVISLIPLILFYGFGILSKDDFEHLPWALAMLLAGGNVLGHAVDVSTLLQMCADLILKFPRKLYLLSFVSTIIMGLAASFISHTVSALVLLSLFAKVGATLNHPKLMVMTSIIMCSAAMPLPISSFPNLNAISVTNGDGEPYLTTKDFLKVGVLMTVFGFFGANSVTYGMSLLLGFQQDTAYYYTYL